MITRRQLDIMRVNSELKMLKIKMFRANLDKEVNYVQPPQPQEQPQNTALPNAEMPLAPAGGING
jgi:hypothetical protein